MKDTLFNEERGERMNLSTLFQIMGGVGLFLYGIKLMGDALQDLAGDRMRTLIASLTSTPLKGALVGTLVTMVIQSSAATTIMSVSFVQAGMMTLKQALGVIMGANIGTTVTAQLVAFNMKELALPLLGVGMLLAVFGHSKKRRYIGNGIFGFGLLFIGMSTMEHALGFLAANKQFFLTFAAHPLLGVAAGTLLTMAVQSSSATVGLTIAMAVQGLLPLQSAIAILLGDNLGTTITAVIAALGSSRSAKQAAAGHVLFNLLGVMIFLPLLGPYTALISHTSGNIARQLANAHTLFNVVNTMLQLPFVSVLARLIQKLLPSRDEKVYAGARYLNESLLNTSPAAALTAVRNELLNMGGMALEMLDLVRQAFAAKDPAAVSKLNQVEDGLNDLTRRVASFAARLWQRHISDHLSSLLESLVNGSSDIERIGDHAQNMMELYEYLQDHRLEFSPSAVQEFSAMLALVREMVQKALEALRTENVELAREVSVTMEDGVDAMERQLRHMHMQRLNDGTCTPSSGVIFIDLISNMERIGDHATNVAEIVLETSGLQARRETGKKFEL